MITIEVHILQTAESFCISSAADSLHSIITCVASVVMSTFGMHAGPADHSVCSRTCCADAAEYCVDSYVDGNVAPLPGDYACCARLASSAPCTSQIPQSGSLPDPRLSVSELYHVLPGTAGAD